MGISIWQLLIILAIVILLFGTKRLKNIGGDLGSALKGFKKAIKDDDTSPDSNSEIKHEKIIEADQVKDADFNKSTEKQETK